MSAEAMSGDLVEITRRYYDSHDADNFYFHVWGGEDIHIGIYEPGETDIARASRRTIERMAERLPRLGPGTRVLDLGAGYGGAARHLVRTTGCHVTALNVSTTENTRSQAISEASGLASLVEVLEGSYEDIPAPGASYDVVWSQDAMLHSGRKQRVMAEAARVLRPGGDFIFTDPMESGSGSREDLRPVLERIHLSEMGSYRSYTEAASRAGLDLVEILDLTPHLPLHYALVRDDLLARRGELAEIISAAFIERMLIGLDHWVRAGERGNLAWGILHFRKCYTHRTSRA
jgi:sarcosine/dimethylglycine N-methyltransferase